MDTSVLGVSIHHALGGRPLWLAVLTVRNSTEAHSAATLAGHRLHRVTGGFFIHFPLDAFTSAVATRLSEVAIVATYLSRVVEDADTSRAQTVVEAARAAVLEACGGRTADVTLLNLNRYGAAIQLALRKAVSGFGLISGISTSKFDFSSIQISPDVPPDDSASLAVRAANDVTAATLQSTLDALSQGYAKTGTLTEQLRAVKPPASHLTPARSRPRHRQAAFDAFVCGTSRQGELASLLPLIPVGGLRAEHLFGLASETAPPGRLQNSSGLASVQTPPEPDSGSDNDAAGTRAGGESKAPRTTTTASTTATGTPTLVTPTLTAKRSPSEASETDESESGVSEEEDDYPRYGSTKQQLPFGASKQHLAFGRKAGPPPALPLQGVMGGGGTRFGAGGSGGLSSGGGTGGGLTSPTRFTRPQHELGRPWAPAEDEDASDEEAGVVMDHTMMPPTDREDEEEEGGYPGSGGHSRKPSSTPPSRPPSTTGMPTAALPLPLPVQQPQQLKPDAFDAVFGALGGGASAPKPALPLLSITPTAAASTAVAATNAGGGNVSVPFKQPTPLAPALTTVPAAMPTLTPTAPFHKLVPLTTARMDAAFDLVFGSPVLSPPQTTPASVSAPAPTAPAPAPASVQAPVAAQASAIETPVPARAFAPLPVSHEVVQVPIKLAAHVSESVSVEGHPGGSDKSAIEGTISLKYMYAAPLPPAIQASGHGALPFSVQLRTPGPLASLDVVGPDGTTVEHVLTSPQATSPAHATGSGHTTTISLRTPPRAGGVSGNPPIDLPTLRYKYSDEFQRPIVKVAASAKLAFGPPAESPTAATASPPAVEGATAALQQQQQHRGTDVLVKVLLHPAITHACTGAQFLVQLPPAPPHHSPTSASTSAGTNPSSTGAEVAEYEGVPLMKPQGQWNKARAQILWPILPDDAPLPAGLTEDNAPRAKAFFVAGKPCEFKGRVLVKHGMCVSDVGAFATPTPVPLQYRFALPASAVAPPHLSATPAVSGGDTKDAVALDVVSNCNIQVQVSAILVKASSAVKGSWKP